MTAVDRDALIRAALAPADTLRAPVDLGDDVLQAISAMPQRSRPVGGFALPRWFPAISRTAVLAAVLGLLVLLGILVAVASRRPAIPAELTMYRGGPARTGILPGPGPAGTPSIVWQQDLHGQVLVQVVPLVRDGMVFIADEGGFVTALDAATGTIDWEVDVGSPIHSVPVLDADHVIVGADDGRLTAIRIGDHERAWQTTPGGPIQSSLVVADGVLYVGSDDGALYGIDPATGATLRTFVVGGPVSRGPAIDAGVIYVGSSGGRFAAFDAVTGAARWSVALGDGETGTPTVAGGLVFVPRGLLAASGLHDAVALDITDGTIRWSFATATHDQVYVGAVAGGTAYLVSKDGSVYARDAATGSTRWTSPTGAGIGALVGVADDVIYVTNDGRMVLALDATTGVARWSVAVPGIPTMTAVIDGRVFVATSLGKIVALASP